MTPLWKATTSDDNNLFLSEPTRIFQYLLREKGTMEAECWNNNCMLELSKKKGFDFDKNCTNLFTTIKIHETIPHWREEGIAG